MRPCWASICASVSPYFLRSISRAVWTCPMGALGCSSNDRWVTVTWSRCSNRLSAFSSRWLPSPQNGQMTSDQISICIALVNPAICRSVPLRSGRDRGDEGLDGLLDLVRREMVEAVDRHLVRGPGGIGEDL